MSLPKQYSTTTSPPLSSSKQSIRGTAPASSVPSRLHLPPISQPEHEHHEAVEDIGSQDYQDENLPSNPHQPFQPFFTLVEDANTGEYHHPTVHYIFSDDDTDILTEAAVRSLESEQENTPNIAAKGPTRGGIHNQQHHQDGESYNEEDELSGSGKAESFLPPPIPGFRDNYIILDVDPTSIDTSEKTTDADPSHAGVTKSLSTSPANQTTIPPPQQNHDLKQQQQPSHQFTVTSAHSLTPAWQVLNTELVPAPTFENNTSGEQSLNGGLMLKIHGTPGLPASAPAKDRDKERGSQRLEDMMDQFAKRMTELRQVIDAGCWEQTGFSEKEQQQQQQQDQDQHGEQTQPVAGDNHATDNNDNATAGTAQEELSGQPKDYTQAGGSPDEP